MPKEVLIPAFETDALPDANTKARATIEVYNKYRKEIENIIELLKTDKSVREEFSNEESECGLAQLLLKYKLPVNTLPKVLEEKEGTYEGVEYIIYKLSRTSKSSADNKNEFFAFIKGIQLYDFNYDGKLNEKEREIAHDVLENIILKNALYNEPRFLPEEGIITHLTPKLKGNESDEVKITHCNKIQKGKVVPFIESYYYDETVLTIEATIRAHNKYKSELHNIIEKLRTDKEIIKEIQAELEDHHINQHVDGVAEILGSYGAEFIVKNPNHKRRGEELEDFKKRIGTSLQD